MTKRDIENEVYDERYGYEVPYYEGEAKADPYASDLIEGYWTPMRKRIKDFISPI